MAKKLIVYFLIFFLIGFCFLPARPAEAAVLNLYARNVALTSPFPTSSWQMTTTAGAAANTATYARSANTTTGYFQFRPGLTNTTNEASLPAGITQYGWIYDTQIAPGSTLTAGAWTLRVRWQCTSTSGRGYLNYRITKVTASGGNVSLAQTLLGWTEDSTLLVPAAANTSYTRIITTPSVSSSVIDSGEYLMIEWYIRPTVGAGGGNNGWRLVVNESEANSGTRFTTTDITAPVFAQKQENWRFYNDSANVPPADGNALAAENTAPSQVDDEMILRLRISIKETGGANQSAASVRKLQWSTSPVFATVNDVDNQGGSGLWRYYNGPATDGTDVSVPYKLVASPAPTTGGKYCESNTPTYQLLANQVAEFEYTLQGNGTLAGITYYFRLWDNTTGAVIALDTGKSYPSLIVGFYGNLSLSGVDVSWSGINPDFPPNNTGKGLICTVSTNGSWQVTLTTSSGDASGRLWSVANSMAYDGAFSYTSSGAAGPNYQTSSTSFTTTGTNVANYSSVVSNWQINVSYNLSAPSWDVLAGTYTATHTYTLAAL